MAFIQLMLVLQREPYVFRVRPEHLHQCDELILVEKDREEVFLCAQHFVIRIHVVISQI